MCKRRVPGPARLDFRERSPRLIGTSVSDGIVEQSEFADIIARRNGAHLPYRFLDLCAPVERDRSTQDAVPADAEVRVERHQLARRAHRILQAPDLVKHFRVIFAHIRIARVDLHRAQVVSFGVGVMELCTRDVAERVFGGRGVGFERGGTLRRGRLASKQLGFDRGSHVRGVPKTHLIGQRQRRPRRGKLRCLRDRRLKVRDCGGQVAALAEKRATFEILVICFGIDRRARRHWRGKA